MGERCEVKKMDCRTGGKGPCGQHGECRRNKDGGFFCACHLWWKGNIFVVKDVVLSISTMWVFPCSQSEE